jgi:hypothetical protein
MQPSIKVKYLLVVRPIQLSNPSKAYEWLTFLGNGKIRE